VSLFGTLLCVVVMFLMDHITALITFILIICLYICVSVRKPDANWGSSTQVRLLQGAISQ
jgi:solute carrier family 12 sodium/potassium/chloride transporter 2